MKRGIFSRLLCLILALVCVLCVCGCADKSEQKAVTLENGWSYITDIAESSDSALAKGFSSKETFALTELAMETEQGICCSNTFKGNLSVGSGEKAVLTVYDALGNITLWLNGKEIAAKEMGAGKYSFDVTKAVKKGSNTLVVKALPLGEDKLVSPGSMVDIAVHSAVYVEDVYTVSDTENKVMKVYAVVNNTTDKEETLSLKSDIASMDNNAVSANYSETVNVPAGTSTVEFSFNATDFIEWSNENPFLYMLSVKLGNEVYSDYVGYKSFEVNEEGTFLINGKPILIKAADITEDEGYAKNLYEILNYVKVAGFNTVHINDGVATARLLEYCDRLGLLVYEGETTAELALRDRSHVSLCMADSNASVWKEAGVAVAVVEEDGIANSLGEKVEMNIVTAASIEELKAVKGDKIFVKSVGLSGAKENAVDISLAKDWYEAFDIDSVMAMGEINDVINNVSVRENSVLLDYVRNMPVCGLCFTTDISMFKTDLTEIINDDLNTLRFAITTDKANAYNTDTLKVSINLSNFGVLTEGKYDVLVRITGEGTNPYEKTVSIEIDPDKTVQKVLEEEIPLVGLQAGEYILSAEFYEGAHAVCGEKTILVHDKAALPKVSGKVYTLGVSAGVSALLTEQGATVEEFTGAQNGVIIIGEKCDDAALIEKAYANGTKVIVLGAQNKEKLPVAGAIAENIGAVSVLYNNELTKNMVNTGVLYESTVGGYILSDSRFETEVQAKQAISAFSVNTDGSVEAGSMFAMFEDKYVISTLAVEDNITNPYAANLLLNAIK